MLIGIFAYPLFGSVLEGRAERFTAHLSAIGTYLDVSRTAFPVRLVVRTARNIAGYALDDLGATAAISLIIHSTTPIRRKA